MSIIHDPEKSKRFGKSLIIFSLAILGLLLLSYQIPDSWIDSNPVIVYTVYYSIPVILLIGGFLFVRKIEGKENKAGTE